MNYYTKEDLKKELERRLTQNKEELKQWEQVKRVSKKDQSDFKDLSRNIKGAKIRCSIWNENELYINNDTYIYIYGYCEDLPKEDPRYTTEKQGLLDPRYNYTIDEIFQAVEEEKERLKQHIKEYEKQLNLLDIYINKANDIITVIKKMLSENDLHYNHYDSTLYYLIKDYIKNNI